MAAIGAITTMLKSGDHVVVTDNTYGGTFRLFDRVLRRYQLTFTYVDTSQPRARSSAAMRAEHEDAVRRDADESGDAADRPRRRAPRSRTAAASEVVVDNTFASPCVQRPIEFGADMVVHSTTKYLNGHSDSIGGIVVAVRDDDIEWLKFIQNAEGAILSPFDSWLVLRGTKTLAVRMAQHNVNGLAMAEFLRRAPKVKQVLYPGLPEHPQHELAKRQMSGFGGMLVVRRRHASRARDRVCNGCG